MSVFPAIFKSVFYRQETKLFLAFSFMPLVYLLTTFIESSFLNISSSDATFKISFIELYDGLFNLTMQSILPSLALFLLMVGIFRKEIDNNTLFLYKDIDRKKVYWAKMLSVFLILLLFVAIFFLTLLGVYYTRVVHLPYGTYDFSNDGVLFSLYSTFITILLHGVYIFAGAWLALTLNQSRTMIAGLVLIVLTQLLPVFPGLNWLVPNGFRAMAGEGQFGLAFILAILVAAVHATYLMRLSIKKFQRLEF